MKTLGKHKAGDYQRPGTLGVGRVCEGGQACQVDVAPQSCGEKARQIERDCQVPRDRRCLALLNQPGEEPLPVFFAAAGRHCLRYPPSPPARRHYNLVSARWDCIIDLGLPPTVAINTAPWWKWLHRRNSRSHKKLSVRTQWRARRDGRRCWPVSAAEYTDWWMRETKSK
eukprot:COSAG02_NODE_15177_length_1196_cov_16.396911_2_plen_170_part_00